MRRIGIAALLLSGGIALTAQTPPPADHSKLEFEVASIKALEPAGRGPMMIGTRGGPGTPDPGRIVISGLPLKFLIMDAYNLKPYQVIGPDWINSERFDITAKVPDGTTKEQARVMMQNLLAERFGLKVHHETKDSQIYELVVAKNGPKIKESEDQSDPQPGAAQKAPPPPPGPPKLDKNGFPQLSAPGLIMMITMSPTGPRAHMVAKGQTLDKFADMLGNQVNQLVVNKTGLTKKYDLTLEFEPTLGIGGMPFPPKAAARLEPGPGAGAGPGAGPVTQGGPGGRDAQTPDQTESGPTIFTAVQEQLGLKLDQKKAPLDTLVIDHVEKTPTEN